MYLVKIMYFCGFLWF